MKRIVLDLQDDIVEKFKIHVVKNQTSMKAVTEKLIVEYMEREDKNDKA